MTRLSHTGILRRTPPGLALCLLAILAVGCDGGGDKAADDGAAVFIQPFVDRTATSGIAFEHFNGGWGALYIAEVMGPGCALFDYDNDGDLDAFIVQGSMLGEGKTLEDATLEPKGPLPPRDRLFRSEWVETGELKFTDVTDAAGIDSRGYGMGAAAGDYDADGWVDLYVTNLGENLLLRNNGDGTFADVTVETGVQDERWSASSIFVDYDTDGRLDLFVTNYVDFTPANHRECFLGTGALDYCGPLSYRPYPDRLFRNRGDGTFEDVTAESGIARTYGAGLGVVSGDFNSDGFVDLYVANDAHPNNLWLNQGDGTFADRALVSGCAFNQDGKAESSMGIDAADFDGDGDDDLFMTHLRGETNTLYLNDGNARFDDRTFPAGLGVASRNSTGFGAAFVDFDNDTWLDIVIANGAAHIMPSLARTGDPYPLHQPNQIFRNTGKGSFEELSDRAGSPFAVSEVGRGFAIGDLDNDGDSDLLLTNNNGPARVLVNQVGNLHYWLGLRVMDAAGATDVIGSRIEVVRGDGARLWRRVRVAASYCTSNDPRVLVGLGDDPKVDAVRVHWPDGDVEEWTNPEVDRYLVLKRGAGREL
jgi:hypothetical protein